jgi:serine/threonine-protein kinase
MSRWELVQELFDATVGLDGAERARVLRERAPADTELARELEGLIAAAERPLAALEGTAAGLLPALRDELDPQALCGASFGPYVVEEHLSSGGMAHVYRARRQSAGTERRVALKVLRPGLSSVAFLERFQRERETLARLEHEHIVAFLDAGELQMAGRTSSWSSSRACRSRSGARASRCAAGSSSSCACSTGCSTRTSSSWCTAT